MAEIKERILVIAPDPNERAVIVEAALEPYGYQVTSTDDGSMALQLIFNEYPDAIVMDFNPPNLSGADILAALNSQSMDVPVVVLANPGREKDALHAFRLGARDYLVRPVREAPSPSGGVVYDVVGPVCESGDFLAKDRPLSPHEGDLLAIMSAGAYGMVMSSNYNSRPRAAEVLVSGTAAHLVRSRESVEQLFALERIPG